LPASTVVSPLFRALRLACWAAHINHVGNNPATLPIEVHMKPVWLAFSVTWWRFDAHQTRLDPTFRAVVILTFTSFQPLHRHCAR